MNLRTMDGPKVFGRIAARNVAVIMTPSEFVGHWMEALYSRRAVVVDPGLRQIRASIIEAMTCGKPVVGARATVIPETIGSAGITFDPSSVHDFAGKVVELLRNENLARLYSVRGVERAREFSVGAYRKNFDQFLDKIL